MMCFNLSRYEDNVHANNFPEIEHTPGELHEARKQLQGGVQVIKYGGNAVAKAKVITLDPTAVKLVYTPSSKSVVDTTIYIKDVVELRDIQVGKANLPDTAVFRKCTHIPQAQQDFCSSIVYKRDSRHKSLNLQFQSAADKKNFQTVIAFLVNNSRRAVTKDPETMRILDLWMQADRDNDRKLTREEVTLLLQRLNVQLNKSALKEMFRIADKDQSNFLSFEEFKQFYKALHKREEVEVIFKTYTSDSLLDRGALVSFLRSTQMEEVTDKRVTDLLCEFGCPNKGLTLPQFTNYLFSKRNSWWNTHEQERVTQDMNAPLNHYYISSSHNTYLTGHQLHSRSSVDMYKIILERGCRCVELDCWDGADGDPEIYHGYTRTTKIKFRDVCDSIAKSAFKTSVYPVILSLEVHTSEKQQIAMAHIMRECFGSYLLPRGHDLKLTPDGLKYKILVKGKMASEHYVKREDEDSEDDKEEPNEVKEKRVQGNKRIALALSDVITIRATKVKDWGLNSQPNEIQSYSEGACLHLLSTDPARFIEMNRNMLSRTYPSGTRIASDNYDPFIPWSVGVQCVALNHQTNDHYMRLMRAKFEANGGCGYLLKPRELIGSVEDDAPCLKFVVTVISGSQIPKTGGRDEVVNPYVTLQINGTKDDTSDIQKTNIVRNNGFSPVWSKQFPFAIRRRHLAMLTLRVIDSDRVVDEKIAEAIIPLRHLRLGYRCVPLRSLGKDMCELENAYLFCKFSLGV